MHGAPQRPPYSHVSPHSHAHTHTHTQKPLVTLTTPTSQDVLLCSPSSLSLKTPVWKSGKTSSPPALLGLACGALFRALPAGVCTHSAWEPIPAPAQRPPSWSPSVTDMSSRGVRGPPRETGGQAAPHSLGEESRRPPFSESASADRSVCVCVCVCGWGAERKTVAKYKQVVVCKTQFPVHPVHGG